MANGAGGIERDPLVTIAQSSKSTTTLERAISVRSASLDEVVNDDGEAQAPPLLSRFSSQSVVQNVISRLLLRPLHKTVTMPRHCAKADWTFVSTLRHPMKSDGWHVLWIAGDSSAKVQLAENIASGDLAVRWSWHPTRYASSAMNQRWHLKGHRAAIELNIRDPETQAIALQQANDDLVSEIAEQ